MVTSNSYTANGNYQKTSSSSGSQTVNYEYNEKSGLLQSMGELQYGYDRGKNASSVTQKVSGLTNGAAISNQYKYQGNELSQITHNGTQYLLTQNAFGNLSSLKIGSQAFVTNNYSKDKNQILNSTAFGNGQALSYRYDGQNRLTGMSEDGGATWRYTYQYAGGVLKSITDHVRNTKLVNENGETKEINLSTGEASYSYKAENNKQIYKVAGGTYTLETQASSRDMKTGSSSQSSLLHIGEEQDIIKGNTLSFSSTTDYFGRLNRKGISQIHKVGTSYNVFNRATTLTYEDYANNETGTRIKTYQDTLKHGTSPVLEAIYGYTYDAKGNITSIAKDGSVQSSYTYDEAGQLRSETNNGVKTTYQYDVGGNLRTKTAGNTTINYEYADANWRDKLTAYNGKPITYDSIGNPLTYDGWTYTWEAGRRLKKMVKGTTTIEYQYNEEGLRTQKRVTENGITTVSDYVWDEGELIGQTIIQGVNKATMYFVYDEKGKAAGFVYNNSENYYYQTNAQGDICAILKEDGTIAAEYTYDAWGTLLSSSGSMALVNPLTYRGYQYDNETGYYYLQSRYYSPDWGRLLNADIRPYKEKMSGFNLFAYCLNNAVNLIDPEGDKPSSEAIVVLTVLLIDGLIRLNASVAEFMLLACDVTGWGNAVIHLWGYEKYIKQFMYIDPNAMGRDITSIDSLIIAIPEFKLMVAWLNTIHFGYFGYMFPLNPSVLAREIAFHIFGFVYFPQHWKLWNKCKDIDINYHTDRFYEKYIFGYNWPKWLEWLI